MIFSGDIVFPNSFSNIILNDIDSDFLSKKKIVNLESLINLEDMIKTTDGIGLLSSKDIIHFLNKINVKFCSQCNNHITDYNTSINEQKKFLKDNGIGSFGAGDTINQAAQPIFYTENNERYCVISFGWETIGCIAATNNRKGVNPLRYSYVKKQVSYFLNNYDVKLICMFHWNYEYELYPQPAHRQLAFELVEMGVHAIIGHHPHIVQGYEVYKKKPIFYSLGNFYFPSFNYDGYEINFKEKANIGLSVDISDNFRNTNLYWTRLDDNKKLSLIKKETLMKSKMILNLSKFSGLSHKDYILWFKENRKKKKLLPIYKNINRKYELFLKDKFVNFRQLLINLLVNYKIKK